MEYHKNDVILIFQLPQPNAKPLKYESTEIVRDTVDAFLKTEPSGASAKSKSSEASLNKREESRLSNVKNANDVFSWDMYKQPAGYVASKPKSSDFLSRLDDTVKTIDFNNMSGSESVDSSPQVTINKRARLSPDDCTQTYASTSAFIGSFANQKRKKLKVVPNSDAASLSSSNQTSQESFERTPTMTESQELPSDRKELLKFVSCL